MYIIYGTYREHNFRLIEQSGFINALVIQLRKVACSTVTSFGLFDCCSEQL